MTVRRNAIYDVCWPEALHFDDSGKTMVIALLGYERAFLAYAGCAAEGWCVYLVSAADRTKMQQVSPLFLKDFGETRRDMMEACVRAYGEAFAPVVNLGMTHPDEAFYWRTSAS